MILIDDADILFEDDDKGFWGSLLYIISSAKCPIILTCTGIKIL
jgi:hypothetical protein